MKLHPLIIAHNCGYIGYNEECYSLEATRKAYQECDYLEIDLILKQINGEKKWWYFHEGIFGGEGRENGISIDQFLNEFKAVANEMNSKPKKPGLFLDLKEHLDRDGVNELMNYLGNKYENNIIPTGTPLMIYTGRDALQSVFRDTTRHFLKWLHNNQNSLMLNSRYCPKLTIVTREVDVEKVVKGKIRAALNDSGKKWFWDSYNKKVWWSFNPHPSWLYKYFHKYFKHEYQIFEKSITLIPWFTKREETEEEWIKVILTILKNYWLYKSTCSKTGTMPTPASWGIITYKPNEFIDFVNNLSFDDI